MRTGFDEIDQVIQTWTVGRIIGIVVGPTVRFGPHKTRAAESCPVSLKFKGVPAPRRVFIEIFSLYGHNAIRAGVLLKGVLCQGQLTYNEGEGNRKDNRSL